MKRTLTTLFSLISLSVMAQSALPQVFTYPLTGFNRIREENPYMLMEVATDGAGTNWAPYNRMIRTKSPLLRKTIEDRTSSWENDTWKDSYVSKDSFITEADQTTIKTDFYSYVYNYPSFHFEQKGKYLFTNDAAKRPIQIIAQSANPSTSNNYVNDYKLSIQYDATGLRIKDTYQFYNPAGTSTTRYTYNEQRQVTANYSFNQAGDSSGKGFCNYSPEHRILNFTQFSFDEDLFDWLPSSADTFEYDSAGNIVKYTRWMMISVNGGNPEFGPYSIEEYTYTATGKLSGILVQNWNGEFWQLSSKMVFTYVNEKPTFGYFYASTNGTTPDPNPSYRYSFAPLSGTAETTAASLHNLNIYPNPGNESVTVDMGQSSGTAMLYDTKGLCVQSITFSNQTLLNTSELTPGIYLLKIQSGSEQHTRKILIQH